ncbi:MAG: J domain-containing protein [Planctomycetota bacterium]|nr:J domain-containing protein [Planctomycetota bacterium]
MAASNDYYTVLGVDRTATAEEIRKAYRRLARKYHPDVNKANDAATKFNEVQEAYDTLCDAEKRRSYDQFGSAGVSGGSGFRGNPQWAQGGFGQGGVDFAEIFGQAFGGGAESPFSRSQQVAKGSDRSMQITVTFMTALKGGVEQIPIGESTAELQIPAGIQSGTKLRLKGKGESSASGGATGDLLVAVMVGGHPLYQRNGLDVEIDVDINIAEASLGTKVSLPLPLGGSVDMSIPKGISSGTRLRVQGKGCVDSRGATGDFYAVIHIVAPTNMDDETTQLLEKLNQRLPNPREDEIAHDEKE